MLRTGPLKHFENAPLFTAFCSYLSALFVFQPGTLFIPRRADPSRTRAGSLWQCEAAPGAPPASATAPMQIRVSARLLLNIALGSAEQTSGRLEIGRLFFGTSLFVTGWATWGLCAQERGWNAGVTCMQWVACVKGFFRQMFKSCKKNKTTFFDSIVGT